MTEEKQIEEMAKDMCDYARGEICILDDKICDMQCTSAKIAEKLTAKGYRKQREGEWIYENTVRCLVGTDAPLDCRCSLCGRLATNSWDFCPSCGAKMRGDTE